MAFGERLEAKLEKSDRYRKFKSALGLILSLIGIALGLLLLYIGCKEDSQIKWLGRVFLVMGVFGIRNAILLFTRPDDELLTRALSKVKTALCNGVKDPELLTIARQCIPNKYWANIVVGKIKNSVASNLLVRDHDNNGENKMENEKAKFSHHVKDCAGQFDLVEDDAKKDHGNTISIEVKDSESTNKRVTEIFVVNEIVFMAWAGFRKRTIKAVCASSALVIFPLSFVAGLRFQHPFWFLAGGGFLFVCILKYLMRQTGIIGTTSGKVCVLRYSFRQFSHIIEEYLSKFTEKRNFMEFAEQTPLRDTRYLLRTDKVSNVSHGRRSNWASILFAAFVTTTLFALLASLSGEVGAPLAASFLGFTVNIPLFALLAYLIREVDWIPSVRASQAWQILEDFFITQGARVFFIGGAGCFFLMKANDANDLSKMLYDN